MTNVLESEKIHYHIGITHTTNKRFWEFNEDFVYRIKVTRPQAIEMECATLFMAGYYHKFPLGALLLISDMPLERDGIKTKESSQSVFAKYTENHVEIGVRILQEFDRSLADQPKGVFRGRRRHFEQEREGNISKEDKLL